MPQWKEGGYGTILESPENEAQATPQFQTSDPKNCESTNFDCFKLPNVCQFVLVTLGN